MAPSDALLSRHVSNVHRHLTPPRGRRGCARRYDEAKLRVGVEFAKPFGLLSLKSTNLAPLDDSGNERASMLMKGIEEEQAKKFPPHMKLYPDKKSKNKSK